MDFLKEWVRGLVSLMLLAAALEFMIPASSMRKYVRMVMGLVIMLTVVKPLTGVVGRPLDQQVFSMITEAAEPTGVPTLAQIMVQAKEFRNRNQHLALDELRARVIQQAQTAALEVPGVAEASASAVIREGPKGYRVESVRVAIVPGKASGGPTFVSPMWPIAPVAPVLPGRGRSEPDQGEPGRSGAVRGSEMNQAESALVDAVRKAVALRLELSVSADVVRVDLFRGEPTVRR